MRLNGCPVCGGSGRLIGFGLDGAVFTVGCPECAGLPLTPASADDPNEFEWKDASGCVVSGVGANRNGVREGRAATRRLPPGVPPSRQVQS